MTDSIPLDDIAALEAVYSGSIALPAPQLAVASAALAVALAEALTIQAEACECATSPGTCVPGAPGCPIARWTTASSPIS